jgi:molybdopterin-guanine dinucleotide biosynthesis protein MobB
MLKTPYTLAIIAANSGVGKTTFIEKIIPGLLQKDSYRLRKAGAYQTLIMNQKRSALLTEFANDPDTFEKAIKKMDQNVDLIIIEGLKSLNFPKIEVYRSTTSLNKLVDDDPSIIAVVSDMMFPCKKPLFDINNTDAIEQFICNLIKR